MRSYKESEKKFYSGGKMYKVRITNAIIFCLRTFGSFGHERTLKELEFGVLEIFDIDLSWNCVKSNTGIVSELQV